MLIREVADHNTQRLAALSQFLLGRSEDESATKQISQETKMFISLDKFDYLRAQAAC